MRMLGFYMRQLPLVAILRGIVPDEVESVCEVLLRAGFVMMEVPLNSPHPFRSIEKLSARFGNDCLIGAGTVTDKAQVLLVKKAGGRLIVSPHTNADLISMANNEGMLVVPGCFSPTDVFTALQAGASAIKLFPAEAISPASIKAMRAVLPADLLVLAVGGIDSSDMVDYLQCGVDGFGIGSSLYKPGKSLDVVATDALSLVQTYREAGSLENHGSHW